MKKGIMFSVIMIFLAITLITLIGIQRSLVSHRRERMHIETRINSMNNLYESILRDIEKTTEIIVRRAITISVNKIVETGEGLDPGTAIITLEKLTFNETPSGWEEEDIRNMENATLPYWIDKIEAVSILKGFEVDINIREEDFEIKPHENDSWNLLANINITINITDQQGIASIRKNVTLNELISIEDLEDPLYTLKTNGVATNIIVRSPYDDFTSLLASGDGSGGGWRRGTSVLINSADHDLAESVPDRGEKILITDDITAFDVGGPDDDKVNEYKGLVSESDIYPGITIPYVVNVSDAMNQIPNNTILLVESDEGSVWNIEKLIEHVENSYYHGSENGPSYLDRLEGSLTCNYCDGTDNIGLESFVDKVDFYSRGITVHEPRTNIDYLYFNSTYSPPIICKVKGLDSSFRIDDGHKETYNVADLTYLCA